MTGAALHACLAGLAVGVVCLLVLAWADRHMDAVLRSACTEQP